MDVSGVNRWPRLSHYAKMDPDSFNLGPSRKRSTRQISRHYLDTFRALLPPFGVRRQLVAFVRAPHPQLLHGIHTCLSLRRQFDILILLRQLANFKANYDIHARRCLLSREITYFHVYFYSRRPGLFSFSFFLFLFFFPRTQTGFQSAESWTVPHSKTTLASVKAEKSLTSLMHR